MSDLSELERLAREAQRLTMECRDPWWSSKDISYQFAGEDAAYIAACSPDQVLRLVAIAKAAERALPALQASMCRMDQLNYELALQGRLDPNPVTAIAALREALSPLNETTKEPR